MESTPAATAMLGTVFYAGAVGLILLGIYCAVTRRHLIRVLLGLTLLQAGVNLFFVAAGFRPDAAAPILSAAGPSPMVDPIPQALILTAIVIGIGVLALGLALAVRVHAAYGTLDTQAVAERMLAQPEAAQGRQQAGPPARGAGAGDGRHG